MTATTPDEHAGGAAPHRARDRVIAAIVGIHPIGFLRKTMFRDPAADEAADSLAERARGRRAALTVALLLLLLLVTATTRDALDSLLKGMQPDDRSAVGISVFRPSLSLAPEHLEKVVDAADRWHDFFAGVPKHFLSANGVVRIHAFVSIGFGVAYASLLLVVLWAVKLRLESRPARGGRDDWAINAAVTGMPVAVALAVAYVVEAMLVWRVVDHVWRELERGAAADAAVLVSASQAWALWLVSAAKLLLGLVAGGAVVIGLVGLGKGRQEDQTGRLKKASPFLRALRAHLLLLALLMVFMSLPQVADVIRGWDGLRAFWALLFLAAVAVVLRLSGSLLVDRVGDPVRPRWPPWRAGALIVGLFGVQLALFHARDVRFGYGLVVPACIVAVVWALGGFAGFTTPFRWLRARMGGAARSGPAGDPVQLALPSGRTPAPARWHDTARATGAVAVVVVGIAIIRAATGPLVYPQRGTWSLALLAVPAVYLLAFWRTDRTSWNGWHIAHLTGTLGIPAGLAVLLLLGSTALSAATLYAVGVLTVFGALPIYFGPRLPRWARRLRLPRDAKPLLWNVVGLLAIWAGGSIWRYARDPVAGAPQAGSAAILLSLFAIVALLAVGMVWLSEVMGTPRLFRRLSFERTPVFLFLLVWIVVASAIGHGDHHDVRVLKADGQLGAVPIQQAFERWKDRNVTADAEAAAAAAGTGVLRRPAVPLVLLSTSGGGIRAAVWTAHVLNCVFEGAEPQVVTDEFESEPCKPFREAADPQEAWLSDRLMVASGVSGGALGLAAYTAFLTVKESGGAQNPAWVRERLGDDYLAAPLSQALLVDVPQLLMGFHHEDLPDAAEMLELAWEASWSDGDGEGWLAQGLFATYHGSDRVPVVVANGSSVADGCRFNASVLEANTEGVVEVPRGTERAYRLDPIACTSPVFFESSPPTESGVPDEREKLRLEAIGQATLPAAWDLGDFICEEVGHDVRLSTMALLSARFPLISPSGRLDRRRLQVDGCTDAGESVVHVVDGGYVDSSGTLTLRDLWDDLQPLVEDHNARAMAAPPPDGPAPQALEPCIVPFMLHIDNGYDAPPIIERAGRPWELLVPLTTLGTSRSGHVANARAAAALEFEEPLSVAGTRMKVMLQQGQGMAEMVSRYARVTTRAHPGVQAPLGWTLSDESINDLGRELATGPNIAHLAEVGKWFGDSLTCEVRDPFGEVAVPDA